jgi:hypothetical protein
MANKDLESTSHGHVLKYNNAVHRYWLDGKPIKGVSGIKDAYPKGDGLTNWRIKQGIEQALPMYQDWFSKMGTQNVPSAAKLEEMIAALMIEVKKEKKMHKAADIGTILHDYAYCKENNLPFDGSQVVGHPDQVKIENAIANFETWHALCKDVVVKSEQPVASWTHWFAGTFDRLVMRDGLLILCDFKTSGSISVEHKLQLAGYRIAAKEWLGMDIRGLEVERFDKDAIGFDPAKDIWTTTNEEEIKEHEEQFLNLLKTVRYDAKYNPYYKR